MAKIPAKGTKVRALYDVLNGTPKAMATLVHKSGLSSDEVYCAIGALRATHRVSVWRAGKGYGGGYWTSDDPPIGDRYARWRRDPVEGSLGLNREMVWSALSREPRTIEEIGRITGLSRHAIKGQIEFLRQRSDQPVFFSDAQRGYWRDDSVGVPSPVSERRSRPTKRFKREPRPVAAKRARSRRMPHDQSRSGRLWQLLGPRPRTAWDLAVELGCREDQARGCIEYLRHCGQPVWHSLEHGGFWTDYNYKLVPRRSIGARGWGAGWQREPPG